MVDKNVERNVVSCVIESSPDHSYGIKRAQTALRDNHTQVYIALLIRSAVRIESEEIVLFVLSVLLIILQIGSSLFRISSVLISPTVP